MRPGALDPKARLLDQDLDNVKAEIVYPNLGLFFYLTKDPEYRRECIRVYNEWLAEYCAVAPDGFRCGDAAAGRTATMVGRRGGAGRPYGTAFGDAADRISARSLQRFILPSAFEMIQELGCRSQFTTAGTKKSLPCLLTSRPARRWDYRVKADLPGTRAVSSARVRRAPDAAEAACRDGGSWNRMGGSDAAVDRSLVGRPPSLGPAAIG